MAPRVLEHPGTRPTEKGWLTVDEKSLAHPAHGVPLERDLKGREETSCLYCLEGWVFLGSIGHDGEEVSEAIRCRRCKGAGRISC